MRFPLGSLIGFIIGALLVSVPFAFIGGRYTQSGVSSEFILTAHKCKTELDKIKGMLTTVAKNNKKRPGK